MQKDISSRSLIRALICLAALYLSFVGQGLLTQWPSAPSWTLSLLKLIPENLGLKLSILAGIIFGLASPRLAKSYREPIVLTENHSRLFCKERALNRYIVYALIAASVGLFFYSNQVHLETGRSSELPAKYSWWASIALFITAMFGVKRLEKTRPDLEQSPSFSKWNYLCLAMITIAAGAIRTYDIVETPVTVNIDNIGSLNFAKKNFAPAFWFIPGIGVHGIPSLALIFLKISIWLHGADIFELRMPEAVLGTLMVLGSYLFVWRSFDSHRLAALTSGLLAANAGHIHFSRHIMNVDPWAFVVFGFFFLIHGIRSQKAWALGAAGLILGFSLQLYLSVRALLFVAPFFGCYLLHNRRTAITKLYDGWFLFICAAVVIIGPNFADMIVWKDLWYMSNRPGSSLLTIQNLYDSSKVYKTTTITSHLAFQIQRILLIPQVLRDTSGQITIDRAMFDLLIAPFLWLGLGSAFASWRRSPAMALCLMTCGGLLLLGQVLFNNIPYWPKLIFLMFTGCLWIAIGILDSLSACTTILAWLAERIGLKVAQVAYIFRPAFLLTLALLVVIVGQRQWQAYALSARRDTNQLDLAGRFVRNLPSNTRVCAVRGQSDTYIGREELAFYAQGRILKELGPQPALQAADQCGPSPFGWFILPEQPELKERLVALYPNGQLRAYYHKYGDLFLWTFYVP